MSTAREFNPLQWRLDLYRLCWLSACLLLVLAPHMLRLPVWITGLFALLCIWRLMRAHGGQVAPPSRWLVLLIGLTTLPGVYVSYGTITGRQAGVALLTVLAATKLLETRSRRDAYVLCYLGFFLIITGFLFSQSMLMAGYMLAVVVVLTATLAVLTRDVPGQGWPRELRHALVLVAQALPVALLLFAVFPRIPGPLWGLPKDAHAGVTGLSEDMSLGSISELSQSDAIAFRVRFDGPVPPRAERYWRGPVLTRTDGRNWTTGPDRVYPSVPRYSHSGVSYDYEVILEPAAHRILPALDLPALVPRGAVLTEDYSLRARSYRSGRTRYRMRSHPRYQLEGSLLQRALAMGLPQGAHPRTRVLALALRRNVSGDADLVREALRFFREQPFRYTLTPAPLTGDPLDSFLFVTREGFCEHYAAAFTVIMRMAGIPARVVTGYQGGEMNPVGEHMVVRQRDAHAWSEVWLDGRGWVRVDPTAQVAPSRIDAGMDSVIPSTRSPALGVLGLSPDGSAAGVLRRLRDTLDAIQSGWNFWVLGYGSERQRSLLSRLGLQLSPAELALSSVVTVTLFMALLAPWLLRRRLSVDPVQRDYLRFCSKLAHLGLPRAEHEGPVDFGQRVARARPDLADRVRDITDRYVALRYGTASGDLESFSRCVAHFGA